MKSITKLALGAAAMAMALSAGSVPVMAANVDGPSVFWKFSVWGKPRAFTSGIEKLAERLDAETGGNFKLKIFYGAQLSKSKENLDGLKVNAFEAATICNFYHPGKTPALMVMSLPFLPLKDFDVSVKVRHGLFEHPILVEEFAKWNAMTYASTHLPQYEFMGRGAAPEKLSGWKGLRVRAGGGIGLAMEKLGAVRQAMPATEVYTAIQRGTADAVSFPFSYAHGAYKIHEVAEWYTVNLTPGTSECPILFNKTAYENLPSQYQDLLWSLRDEVTATYADAYAAADKKYVPIFEAELKGVKYDAATLSAFQAEAGQPVWDEWVASNKDKFDAQGVLDHVLKLAGAK